MKGIDRNDEDKVLVSRRDWLRLTALAAGSAAGLAIGSEGAAAAPVDDSITYPFIAAWAALTSRADLGKRLTTTTPAPADTDVIESLNLTMAEWTKAVNGWSSMAITVTDASGDSLDATVASVFAQIPSVFLAGVNAYTGTGYPNGGCPRLPQLQAIGSLK